MVLQFLYEHYGRKFHEIPFSIWQLYKTEFDFIEWFTCITDYSFILFILISLISHLVRFNRRSQEQKTLLNALRSDVQNLAEQKNETTTTIQTNSPAFFLLICNDFNTKRVHLAGFQ